MLRETHDCCLYQGGTESCQQEQPALTLRNRTCLSLFPGSTSIPCCHTPPNPPVCIIREPLATSGPALAQASVLLPHTMPCISCSTPPHPAQNDLIPIWSRLPGALQLSPGLVGSRSGWVTSECDTGMMQGPAARHAAPAQRPAGRNDAAAPEDAVRTDDSSGLSHRGLVPWFHQLFLWHRGMF